MNEAILMSASGADIDFMIHGLYKLNIFGQDVWITTSHVCIAVVMLVLLVFAFAANRALAHAKK